VLGRTGYVALYWCAPEREEIWILGIRISASWIARRKQEAYTL